MRQSVRCHLHYRDNMKLKNILYLIGTIQILSLIDILPVYYGMIQHIQIQLNEFLLFDLLRIVLLLVIISTIALYFRKERLALRLYYLEFILRLLFFMTTFGFILPLNIIFKNQSFYNILLITVVILELLRLLLTIFLDIKWSKIRNGT